MKIVTITAHAPADTVYSFHYCDGGGEVFEIIGSGSLAHSCLPTLMIRFDSAMN
jgi:hypothetical protein